MNTQFRPIRVLLAGMKMPENQVSRALSRYPNVNVTWKPGDPGVTWPTDCDTAVIVIAQCSHAAYHDVKELYRKKLNRPVFVIREGFTEMKESFEKWLDGVAVPAEPQTVKPEPTVMQDAFETALKESKKPIEPEKKMRKRFSPRAHWTNNFIHRARIGEGKEFASIAKTLNSMGIRTLRDTEWNPVNVYSALNNMNVHKQKPNYEVLASEYPGVIYGKTTVRPDRETVFASPKGPTKSDAHALIQLVVDSEIAKDVKLKLLEALL